MPSVKHDEQRICTDVYGFTRKELLAYLPGLPKELAENPYHPSITFEVAPLGNDVLTIKVVTREPPAAPD